MAKSKKGVIGRIIGVVLTLAAFGYIVSRILAFIDFETMTELDLPMEEMLTDVFIVVLGPTVISIVWSIIRHRYIWLTSLLTIAAMGSVCGIFANNPTVIAILVAAFLIVNFLLCMMANFDIYIKAPELSGDYSGDGSYSSTYSSSSSSSSLPDSGAYGYPAELGASYRPESTSAKDM